MWSENSAACDAPLRDWKPESVEESLESQLKSGVAMANGSAAAEEIWELIRETRVDMRKFQVGMDKFDVNMRKFQAGMEELRATQRETERLLQEVAEEQKEAKKLVQEVAEEQKETDRQLKATDKQLKATDKQLKATDKQLKATDKQLKATDRQLKATDSRFNTQWGRLVESLVEGSLVPLLRARGIEVRQTSRRVEVEFRTPGGERKQKEFDILVVNGDEAVAVEVKTTLTPGMVKYFLSAMEDFKRYFPDYGHKRVYGAVAYLRSESEAAKYAERQGLFVVRATGDSASIVNAEWFVPKAFPSR